MEVDYNGKVVACLRCGGTGKNPNGLRFNGDDTCWQCGGERQLLQQNGRFHRLGKICGKPMRRARLCTMEPNHRGRHSSTAYVCDGCGKHRRDQPRYGPDGEAYCFMCTSPQLNNEREYGYAS